MDHLTSDKIFLEIQSTTALYPLSSAGAAGGCRRFICSNCSNILTPLSFYHKTGFSPLIIAKRL